MSTKTELSNGVTVYTYVGDIPKTLVAQIRTHQRMPAIAQALSCQSSRAVPIKVVMDDVPKYVPKFNLGSKGMSSDNLVPQEFQSELEELWKEHERMTLRTINKMLEVYPALSKGQINRLLEPHRMTKVMITAPESIWGMFWDLRCSARYSATPAAQSEMMEFADKSREVFDSLQAVKRDFHIPVEGSTVESAVVYAARISFRSESRAKIRHRFTQLQNDRHMGPFEHVVYPASASGWHNYEVCGRFVGHGAVPLRSFLDYPDLKSAPSIFLHGNWKPGLGREFWPERTK